MNTQNDRALTEKAESEGPPAASLSRREVMRACGMGTLVLLTAATTGLSSSGPASAALKAGSRRGVQEVGAVTGLFQQRVVGVSASWTDWHVLSHPGNKAVGITLASHPDGRMHAIMIGLDNQVWHNEQTSAGVSASWTDWHVLSHPGNKAVGITSASHPDGRMHAIMIGLDNQVWHNGQTSAGVSALGRTGTSCPTRATRRSASPWPAIPTAGCTRS